jgi:protein Tex
VAVAAVRLGFNFTSKLAAFPIQERGVRARIKDANCMIDLSGVARHLRLSVDQLRVVADLLQQGYQPGFIERYRADETGNLPRASLWLLKHEIDRQLRLEEARQKARHQLPKDAELDAEAVKFLERATTEVEIEATLRAFRSRRQLSQNQENDKLSSQLLEKLIEYQGPPIEDLVAWSAQQLSLEQEAAETVLQQAARLVGMLMHSDTGLNENLRRTIQRRAQLRVELCDPSQVDAADAADTDTDTDGAVDASQPIEVTGEQPADVTGEQPAEVTGEQPADATGEQPTDATGEQPTEDSLADDGLAEVSSTEVNATVEGIGTEPIAAAQNAAVPGTSVDGTSVDGTSVDGTSVAELGDGALKPAEVGVEIPSFSTTSTKKLGKSGKKKDAKNKESKPAKKPVAKMTPRQRRRRWLIAMLQPMKSLKCPLTKLSSYQQLMLGRGRRSQLVKTELQYDRHALVTLARDTFVTDKHPLAKWFARSAEEALEHSLRAKCEADAVNDLEEIAAQRLLENSVDQLRQSLMQRPVRGHCILVIDAVGPKAAAVAIIDPQGKVLAIDEIPCSASPGIVTQNVTRLGELVHQYRVTLVALTNGPARRFLVLSLRELIKQSATSGLRWTMADRSGADAYAVSRSALKELSVHNRRHRAAIWIGRSLQDPLNELLKVDINRLRLGSFQRELPQEPLKQLVRETIAECVYQQGIDARRASVDQLACVPGVSATHAQQIATLSMTGALTSRKSLLEQVSDWTEMDARQAIGVLRVYGSEQPLDATIIHPDDYRLAQRLIENTELETPPAAPEGWSAPTQEPAESVAENSVTENVAPAESSPDTLTAEASAQEASLPQATPAEATPVEITPAEITPAEITPAEATLTEEIPPETLDGTAAAELAVEDSAAAALQGEAAAVEAGAETESGTGAVVESWPAKPSTPRPNWPAPEYPENIVASVDTPPTVDVEKLARGWQVGREKLRQVASCLHAPFADPRLRQAPVPLMTEMPTLGNLQPGMCVWAVVIGVADFGAFVELAPDCSGLIHISRLSPNYIEDPHQCVQVGDLVMAWVVSVDEKKNRVALTALSPAERAASEAAAAERKAEQEEHRRRDRGGQSNAGHHRPATQGNAASGQGSSGTARSGGGQQRTGGGAGNEGRRGGGGAGQAGGGRGRGNQQSGGGRGHGRPTHNKTVVVTSKKPKANITDAMKEGEEPLRSFSDLMQFYQAKRTDEVIPPKSSEPQQAEIHQADTQSSDDPSAES